MSNQSLNQELRSLVNEFTDRLSLAIRRSVLEQVVTAMGGSVPNGRAKHGPGAPSCPGRPRGAARGARGGKRSSERVDAMAAKLLSHVKLNPGQRADQIATALRSDVKTIRPPMQRLLAEKRVKTKGQGGG